MFKTTFGQLVGTRKQETKPVRRLPQNQARPRPESRAAMSVRAKPKDLQRASGQVRAEEGGTCLPWGNEGHHCPREWNNKQNILHFLPGETLR